MYLYICTVDVAAFAENVELSSKTTPGGGLYRDSSKITDILVRQPPERDLFSDHAGLILNKFSPGTLGRAPWKNVPVAG